MYVDARPGERAAALIGSRRAFWEIAARMRDRPPGICACAWGMKSGWFDIDFDSREFADDPNPSRSGSPIYLASVHAHEALARR